MLSETPNMLPVDTDSIQIPSARFEILFKDGSTIGLHAVWQHGAPVLLLRALRFGQSLIVFDMGDAVRELGIDLPATPKRDVPGLVFYHLRQAFGSADEAVATILRKPRHMLAYRDHQQQQLALEAA